MFQFKLIAGLLVLLGVVFLANSNKTVEVNDDGYKGATYVIDSVPVTLDHGFSENWLDEQLGLKVTTSYYGNEIFADLNDDGTRDVAFILVQSSGGTGTFYYLVAGLKTDHGYKGTNAILLGDRIKPESIQISQGRIIVNYLDRATYEPMSTEPSLKVIKEVRLTGTQIEIIGS